MIFSSQEAGEMENKMMEGIAKKNVHNLKDAPREFLWEKCGRRTLYPTNYN